MQCAISTLADYYVEGPYTVPPVARSALASSYVSSGNLTLPDYISRSQARIAVGPLPAFFNCTTHASSAHDHADPSRRLACSHLRISVLVCWHPQAYIHAVHYVT